MCTKFGEVEVRIRLLSEAVKDCQRIKGNSYGQEKEEVHSSPLYLELTTKQDQIGLAN